MKYMVDLTKEDALSRLTSSFLGDPDLLSVLNFGKESPRRGIYGRIEETLSGVTFTMFLKQDKAMSSRFPTVHLAGAITEGDSGTEITVNYEYSAITYIILGLLILGAVIETLSSGFIANPFVVGAILFFVFLNVLNKNLKEELKKEFEWIYIGHMFESDSDVNAE